MTVRGITTPNYTRSPGPWATCPPADAPWFHDGLDVAAPVGFPVQAAITGTVIFAGPDGDGPLCNQGYRGYGLGVVVDNGQGWQALYAHLSEVYVRVVINARRALRIVVNSKGEDKGQRTNGHGQISFEIWAPSPKDTVPGGTMSGAKSRCPVCESNITPDYIKQCGHSGKLGARMTCVVVDAGWGKEYRLPTPLPLSPPSSALIRRFPLQQFFYHLFHFPHQRLFSFLSSLPHLAPLSLFSSLYPLLAPKLNRTPH